MIDFYVSGQSLKFFSPVIAADSLNYLTAKVNFADMEWDGYSKWLHFRQDEELGADTYDIQLNDNNEITAEQKLNLTVGQWEVYLTGTKDESRLTTVPVILTVKESGLIDAPLHELPMSVAEQVDYNASLALRFAQEVREAAEEGKFNGTSLSPLGHFDSEEELIALIPEPKPGDVYSVGAELPYDIYAWDGINLRWRNQGQLQGSPGENGKDGAVFIPTVDANGNISWLNDGGLENPATRNIRGPKGEDGAVGPPGPGAFEKAQEAGYTGTEETFYAALTYMPYHNKRHLPDGADPITVHKANLADDALYSPIDECSGSTNLTVAQLGKTIQSEWNADLDLILTQANSQEIPVGAEFAVLRWGSTASQIVKITSSGVRFVFSGETAFRSNISLIIPDTFSMVALKKITSKASGGDAWLVTGNVEVVE